jgi:phosphoglycerol transferase MdoB-like AlkP superfamily enzyme
LIAQSPVLLSGLARGRCGSEASVFKGSPGRPPCIANGASVGIFNPFIIFGLVALATLGLSRILLMIWKRERVLKADGVFFILHQGIRFDLVLLGMLLIIPAVITPLISLIEPAVPAWTLVLRIYLVSCFAILLYIELATPLFIDQFDLRPNYVFVEYLKYPKEVFATLWSAYKLILIASVSITLASAYALDRSLQYYNAGETPLYWLQALLMSFLALLLCVAMARSTLGHRAVNPSTVAFSSDPLINTLPLNSTYTVLYAIYESMLENSGESPYGDMDRSQATELVKRSMQVPMENFTSSEIPTLHTQEAFLRREKSLNLVIILEESLGADYVGSMGGLRVTPELDRLAEQGIWFENMFATGTRSVRGIEAIISGFTPTPAKSVVKLGKSQTGFFTIARLLAGRGYDTSFIYGGEAHFDNMKRFFANNGFATIIEEKDYVNPVFRGSWGVSDEDLFNKAHDTFEAYPRDQPFFSLVFTSSNHSPFDFPDGRIVIEGSKKSTVDNAVKYADHALGEFIRTARQSDYWDNTLFVVVADHSDKVFGTEPVPVKRFQIPALILGADVKPTRFSPVASQIDLLPTLLSLIGIDSQHPAVGHDLARQILQADAAQAGRAIMQFGGSQAYMKGDQVVILQKGKPPMQFTYANKRLQPGGAGDSGLQEEALAYAVWTMSTYDQLSYRLPR